MDDALLQSISMVGSLLKIPIVPHAKVAKVPLVRFSFSTFADFA